MQHQHPGYGHPQQGAYQPPPAHAHAHGAQPQPPATKSSKLLIILAAGAMILLVCLVVAGVGGWFLYKHFTKQGLPLDAKQMPKESTGLFESPFPYSDQADAKTRELYMAATLGSTVCVPDAANPAMRLSLSSHYGFDQLMTEENLKQAHEVMKCGSSLVKKLKAPRSIDLQFKDAGDKLRVSFLELDVSEMPKDAGHEKYKFGDVDGFCYPTVPVKLDDKPDESGATGGEKKEEKRECHENAFAAFKAGSRWVTGPRKAVAIVAKTVGEPSDELSTSVEFLEQAAAATTGLDLRVIALIEDSVKEPLRGLCEWGARASAGKRDEFMKACFPEEDKVKKPIEALDAKVRALALELDADLSTAKGIRGRLVFVARDKDEAASLEKELEEIAKEWSSHVSNNESKLGKLAADDPDTAEQKVWRAAVQAFIRAIKGMRVSRQGAALVLAFDEPFKDSEKKELEQAAKDPGDNEKAIVAVLEDLIKGPKISEAKLAKLTGPEWAKWLLMPKVKLTTEECQKAEKIAKDVPITDMLGDDVNEEMRKNIRTFRYGSSLVCNPQILQTYRDCIVKAADWRALAACKAPEAPSDDKFGPPDKKK